MSMVKTFKNNYVLMILASMVVCYFAGKLGFFLSSGSGFAALVWPPAGISIIILLYFGVRLWPGIYLGITLSTIPDISAVFADPSVVLQYPHVFIVAGGATLQAYAAVWVIEKFDLFNHDFSDPKKIGGFYIVVGPLSSLISATIASSTFLLLNMRSFNSLFEEWSLWYFADCSSAIIFTTLIFSFIKFKRQRQKAIASFIVIGLILAYSIVYLGKSWEEERLELIFSQKVIAATEKLDQFIAAHVSLDNNIKGFKSFRPNLTKEQFAQFADNNLVQNGNVRSLAWIEIITGEQRPAFEKELAAIHGQEVALWQTATDVKKIPAQKAESYTVVKLIEPFERLDFVVGHVISVDNGRREAMETALLTGEATLTAPVVLVTTPTIPTAATIYRAHMVNGVLDGFTAIAMRINTMMNRLLGEEGKQSFYIDLYDKEAGPALTFRSYAEGLVNIEGLRSHTVEFPVLNRTWVITFTRSPVFDEDNKTSQPLFIAIAGMIFASLMTVGVIFISGQRIFLEKIVMQRTWDLEKANQAKSEFMANMSHDLRTPLNAISGFSEIMSKEMFGKLGSDKYLEYSNDINRSSEYLLSLINDILDLSAIDANKRILEIEELEVENLLEDCLRTVAPLIEEKNHTVQIDFASEFPILNADHRSVKQIFINLISNSIKFTPKSGTIIISGQFTPNYLNITVSDNGQGIAKEDIEQIFAPFSRVDNHPHLTQEGTGLSLTIVNSLVKLHGGHLRIKSEPSKGTEITVEFSRT